MNLSDNEVRALIHITRSKEPVHPSGLQKELDILKGSVSRIITGLQDVGLVERAGGEVILAGTPPAEAFSGSTTHTVPLHFKRSSLAGGWSCSPG